MDIITADLVDAHETEVMSCTVQFRSYGGRERFCGPVRTLKTMEDNLLIRQLLSQEGYGSILVVDGAGSLRSALVGDLIAQRAQDQGWAGRDLGCRQGRCRLERSKYWHQGRRIEPTQEHKERQRGG